ncbi:unnamed protein product [Blepharisma stoltei]|uniref:Uncharacterized protein n=1 Tax=Blepharisma stoltei TaxID=1481888 RepID=A0AAU9IFE3_9CILI|nr:unnamed protein product [Blepharisma stoltei]
MHHIESKVMQELKQLSHSQIISITKEFINKKQGSEGFYKALIERCTHLWNQENASSVAEAVKAFSGYASMKPYFKEVLAQTQPFIESGLYTLSFNDLSQVSYVLRSHNIGNWSFYRKINGQMLKSIPNEISQQDIAKLTNWLAEPLKKIPYEESIYKELGPKIQFSNDLIKILQGFILAEKIDFHMLSKISSLLQENIEKLSSEDAEMALHLFSRCKLSDKKLYEALEFSIANRGTFGNWIHAIQDLRSLAFCPKILFKKCLDNLNDAQTLFELLVLEQSLRQFNQEIPDGFWHHRRVLFFQSPLKASIKNIYLRYLLLRNTENEIIINEF